MADLDSTQATEAVRIVGSSSIGAEQTPVQSTAAGGLHSNLRNNAGTEVGTQTDPLITRHAALVSTSNSTIANLGIGGVFTGTGEDVSNYGNIVIGIFADQAGSFTVQWSNDNVNWRADGDVYNVSANSMKKTSYGPAARYFRLVYTNGGVAQTTFFVQTIYKVSHTKPSTHKISESPTDDTDSEITKAIVSARKAGGTYGNVKLSENNDLQMADTLDNGGVNGIIAVGTTAVAVRVGGANLANRKRLTFMNNGTATLFWGYSSGVTTANGFPIFRNQPVSDAWGPNTTIWIIAASGSHPVPVNEAA